MRFFRHRNGGAKKFGRTEISEETFASRDTSFVEGAVACGGAFHGSFIEGDCTIIDSFFRDSKVMADGMVVSGGRVMESELDGSPFVYRSIVSGSTISGTVSVRQAEIYDSMLTESVIVDPGAELNGVRASGRVRFGAGLWRRAPRVLEIETENGTSLAISEAQNGRAYIGCTLKPMMRWIKKGSLWGRADGWNEDLVRQVAETFEMWMDTRNEFV